MTNKTITLARKLGSDPITHMAGLLELVVNPRSYPMDILHAQIRSTLELVRAALADPVPMCNTSTGARCPGDGVNECKKCPVDPVPPAGGDVEVPTAAWLDLEKIAAGMAYATRVKVNHRQTELVDRAHVTRLQVEVERVNAGLKELIKHPSMSFHQVALVEAILSTLTQVNDHE